MPGAPSNNAVKLSFLRSAFMNISANLLLNALRDLRSSGSERSLLLIR